LTHHDPGVTLKDGTQFCAPRTPGAPNLLNRRVADLEAHVMRLQAENDHLVAAVHDGRLLTVDEALREPASV
jgi:hypothetical protein